MTHTLHRQGTAENLANDYLIIGLPNVQTPDFREKMARFYEICLKHEPVNSSSSVAWRIYVFDDREKVTSVLRDVTDAELGISIVVSGLYNEVAASCHSVGIEPHTINYSLGFWGNKGRLPPKRILELTTMCGHGLISPNLVWHLVQKVSEGLPVADAAREIAKCCVCDIVNCRRCELLLEEMAQDIRSGRLTVPQSSRPT